MNRRIILVLALAATALAAWFAPEPEDEVPVVMRGNKSAASVETARANGRARNTERIASVGDEQVLLLKPRLAFEGDDGLFGALPMPVDSMAPADVAPLAPPIDTTPPPPQLTMQFIGRYVDARGPVAFIVVQGQNLALRPGDMAADGFRVDEIDEQTVSVRHVASGQVQAVRLDGQP